MQTVTLHPENQEQLSALKAFAKALKVKFEVTKSPYSHEFVAKIRKAQKQIAEGKFITLDPTKSIWEQIKE